MHGNICIYTPSGKGLTHDGNQDSVYFNYNPKPDWECNEPFTGTPIDVTGPYIGDESFTIEARIFPTRAHGSRILSFREGGGKGFEFVVPRAGTQAISMWIPKGHHDIGGKIPLNKWSVVAIAVDKRERPAMVHAFHNYQLVGTQMLDFGSLRSNQQSQVGDGKMHPGDSHIFDGTIEYVRVWNNLNALKSVPYWGFHHQNIFIMVLEYEFWLTFCRCILIILQVSAYIQST